MKGNFQLITVVVFIALAIFGILVFSGTIPLGDNNEPGGQGTVTLWGTASSVAMIPLIEEFNLQNPSFVVKYEQKSAESFDQDLLEALAEGRGPDMIFLPDNLAFHYANKIFTIPYGSYPLASFKNSFASGGEVFLTGKGVLAFPITIDPLVMYYNRSMLDTNGVVYPPSSWDEFTTLVPKLTKRDESDKITKSAVALGHFSNVVHAKDILSAMFMQAGSPIVIERSGMFAPALENANSRYNLTNVLKFYTDFADPTQAVYSWNKSFPASSQAFSSENLALYFGYASELGSLMNRNPNHNLGAAPLPQIKGSGSKITLARTTGIAILSSSKNFNTAFTAASQMATGTFASKFAKATSTAPARRDLLNIKQTDAFSPIFYESALFSKAWLDPAPKSTDDIWRRMIDGVLSGSLTLESAISEANSRLGLLLRDN